MVADTVVSKISVHGVSLKRLKGKGLIKGGGSGLGEGNVMIAMISISNRYRQNETNFKL